MRHFAVGRPFNAATAKGLGVHAAHLMLLHELAASSLENAHVPCQVESKPNVGADSLSFQSKSWSD